MLLSCRKHQARDGVCKGAGRQKLNGGMVDLLSPCGKGKERDVEVQAGQAPVPSDTGSQLWQGAKGRCSQLCLLLSDKRQCQK